MRAMYFTCPMYENKKIVDLDPIEQNNMLQKDWPHHHVLGWQVGLYTPVAVLQRYSRLCAGSQYSHRDTYTSLECTPMAELWFLMNH